MRKNTWFYIALLIACIFCLTRCMTSRRADTILMRIHGRYPEKIASIARDSFPCVIKASDTLLVAGDTVISVDCPDSTAAADYFLPVPNAATSANSIRRTRVTTQVKVPIQKLIITRLVEDSAKIFLLQAKINKLTQKIGKLERSVRSWRKVAMIEAGILLLIAIGFYFRIRKKIL